MITAKEYFETYLSWRRSTSNLRSARDVYESYTSMDLASLRQEAEAENPAAMEELGERYLFGLDGLSADTDRAGALFQKAGDAGNPDALHMLAEIHRTPDFGCQDYDAYFSQLERAAEGGSWKAMFNLACAFYKGKEAYDGHGPEADHKKALHWSVQCAVMSMGILECYLSQNCSENFTEYMQGVFALFVQSICVSARQLIRGDGVEKDLRRAKSMLTDAQNFYQRAFQMECSDFTALLNYCE